MFADDLLLFRKASVDNMRCVQEVLNRFCSFSGQQISSEKTILLFSNNVLSHFRCDIVRISGFKEVQSLDKYLGVPALGRAPKKNDFRYLLDKVRRKLAGWKANQLSLTGRITLSKSVLKAMPIYPMMTMPIPSSCIEEIQ